MSDSRPSDGPGPLTIAAGGASLPGGTAAATGGTAAATGGTTATTGGTTATTARDATAATGDGRGRGRGAPGAPSLSRSTARRGVLADLVLAVLPLLAVARATGWLLSLPGAWTAVILTLYAVEAGLILRAFPGRPAGEADHEVPGGTPWPGLDAGSRVTLARSLLVLPVAALAAWPGIHPEAARWWAVGLSLVALALDGVDGWVARRTGTGTAAGARFDMELDAFLMAALALLVWRAGIVDPWVLLIGALRYLFVAAGWIWPVLRGELPPSRRRKTVCVVQGLALVVCLVPGVPPPVPALVAGGALASLVHSFAADVAWLAARADAAAPGARRPRPGAG